MDGFLYIVRADTITVTDIATNGIITHSGNDTAVAGAGADIFLTLAKIDLPYWIYFLGSLERKVYLIGLLIDIYFNLAAKA